MNTASWTNGVSRTSHLVSAAGATCALLLALSACGGGAPSANKAATPPASVSQSSATSAAGPVQARSFSTVAELRDMAVAAGLPCPSWKQDNKVSAAAQSGDCSAASVLSTYTTDISLQRGIDNLESMNQMMKQAKMKPTAFLVGPNWIINWPKVPTLVSDMGGTVQH
jgi:hypothetical protein